MRCVYDFQSGVVLESGLVVSVAHDSLGVLRRDATSGQACSQSCSESMQIYDSVVATDEAAMQRIEKQLSHAELLIPNRIVFLLAGAASAGNRGPCKARVIPPHQPFGPTPQLHVVEMRP